MIFDRVDLGYAHDLLFGAMEYNFIFKEFLKDRWT